MWARSHTHTSELRVHFLQEARRRRLTLLNRGGDGGREALLHAHLRVARALSACVRVRVIRRRRGRLHPPLRRVRARPPLVGREFVGAQFAPQLVARVLYRGQRLIMRQELDW